MRVERRFLGTLVVGTTTLVMALACGDDDDKSDNCVTGDERCACYPNDSCNTPDLVCLSHLCVSTSEGGGSGTGGTSSSGGSSSSSGEGGAGDGGPTSSGGSAGADAGGTTGVDPTGGTTASGGKTSSKGGTTGATGGASAATGGANTATGGHFTGSGGANTSAGQPGQGGEGEAGSGSTSPEGNLISNGDFANGSAEWNVMFSGVGASTFTNGHACVQGDPSALFNFGWPISTAKAFVLEPGVPYTLSFRAIASSDLRLDIKLGHVTTPYTAAYLTSAVLATSWESYSFNVVAASGDSAAGLVFQGALDVRNSICFDDVVLVKN